MFHLQEQFYSYTVVDLCIFDSRYSVTAVSAQHLLSATVTWMFEG